MRSDDQPPSKASSKAPTLLSSPTAWISAGVAGFLLVCLGVAIDVYKHENGAGTVTWSDPGTIVAIGGLTLAAIGTLSALSLLVVAAAGPAESAVSRRLALAGAWAVVAAAGIGTLIYAATTGITVGGERHASVSAGSTPTRAAQDEPPGAQDRAVLSGTLTLDGAPLDAQFVGVRVIRDGLATACQQTIPSVTGGRYQVAVLADTEQRGCGAPGAALLLWTFVDGTFLYSTQPAPWPGDGAAATLDAAFSSATPDGAVKPATEFKGRLLDRSGASLPGGAVLEAYVDDTLCGITSLRYRGENEMLYTLIVAGPEARAGCAEGAALRFRINGALIEATDVNDLARGGAGHELDLMTP